MIAAALAATCLVFSAVAAGGTTPATDGAGPPKFRLKGKVAMDDVYVFNVQPNPPAGKSAWLALGAVIDGYTLSAYDHAVNTLTLTKGTETLQVPMDISAIQEVNLSPADAQQRTMARMAQMKPALEAGQPIRGHVLVLIDGSVAEQTAEFVAGKETRIEVGTAGTLLVTPDLNADGSVTYHLALQAPGPVGAPGRVERFPRVVNTPWDSFSLRVGRDRIFGFQPDAGNAP